jgi:hypothetical protein
MSTHIGNIRIQVLEDDEDSVQLVTEGTFEPEPTHFACIAMTFLRALIEKAALSENDKERLQYCCDDIGEIFSYKTTEALLRFGDESGQVEE